MTFGSDTKRENSDFFSIYPGTKGEIFADWKVNRGHPFDFFKKFYFMKKSNLNVN
jgi:hypothetical protein